MNRKLESLSFGAALYSGSNRGERASNKDEIDLFELLVNGISLIDRHKVLIIILSVLSVCLGMVWFIITPTRYDGQLTIQVPSVERSVVNQMLLAISVQVERRYRKPEGLKSLTLVDGETANRTFIISASVNDPAILPTLQEDIVEYFESNEYVHAATVREKQNIENTILALRQEELRLTSVIEQAILDRNMLGEGQSIADLSKLKMDFYRERLSLQSQLDNVATIQIIQGFSNTMRPAEKSLPLFVLTFLAGAFVLAAVIIAVVEVRGAIRRNQYNFNNASL
jgi:LPS O-antigen subunit length determinant protein (WzzB/FepE family)